MKEAREAWQRTLQKLQTVVVTGVGTVGAIPHVMARTLLATGFVEKAYFTTSGPAGIDTINGLREEFDAEIHHAVVDMTKPDAAEEAAKDAVSKLGRVGYVVHSACPSFGQDLSKRPFPDWDAALHESLITIKLMSWPRMFAVFAKNMAEHQAQHGDGYQHFIGSSQMDYGNDGSFAGYASANGGLYSMVRCFSNAFLPHGCVSRIFIPGFVASPRMPEAKVAEVHAAMPGGRGVMKPEDLVALMLNDLNPVYRNQRFDIRCGQGRASLTPGSAPVVMRKED